MKRIALIAEYDSTFPSHLATEAAAQHSSDELGVSVSTEWVSTKDLSEKTVNEYDGLWIGPGSPYKDLERTLRAIRSARENRIPLLGTCGGFQHVILEYARNVLGLTKANSTELAPECSDAVISELPEQKQLCLLYTSPSPRDRSLSRMPSSA